MNTLKLITLALVCTIAVAATEKKAYTGNANEAITCQQAKIIHTTIIP